MTRLLPLGLSCLVVAGLAPPLRARPCDETDLEVIDVLLAELEAVMPGGPTDDAAPPDDETLRSLAAEAGCEWLDGPGGPADELQRLRWREDEGGPATVRGAARWSDTWWRVFLPRVELRWTADRLSGAALGGATGAGWQDRFELWLLWSLVPLP
jgi:hypothetical protein